MSDSPAWRDDPTGRHTHRYHDGNAWTEHVATSGEASIDATGLEYLNAPPPAAPETLVPSPAVATTPPAATAERKVPKFGARKFAQELEQELATTRAALAELGGLEYAEVQDAIKVQRTVLDSLIDRCGQQQRLLTVLQAEIVATEDTQVLQEVGIYEYRHPLTDATAYQGALKQLRDRIKAMARADGGAVTGATNWTVNGSLPEGRRMVRENSKLMLRAYNAEADNLVRSLKPYKLDTATARLDKVAQTITKLGKTMSVTVSPEYHQLRLDELALTADYLAKKAEEKERERAERERLREEAKVQQEMERERQRLEKEQAHYRNALEALIAKDDQEAADRMRERLSEIDRSIEDVDYRAANVRAGYVYVISNIGAFGDDMVKVGLTRRLEPLDRVRELGDASVPFRYDVHALFFAKDAVGIEQELHRRLSDRRINRVNLRREFFRVTPDEVKAHLLDLAGELLEFTDVPEALEYRQSLTLAEAETAA